MLETAKCRYAIKPMEIYRYQYFTEQNSNNDILSVISTPTVLFDDLILILPLLITLLVLRISDQLAYFSCHSQAPLPKTKLSETAAA